MKRLHNKNHTGIL